MKTNTRNFDAIVIGSGIGGLEILINQKLNNHITFIEKNYVSKKIKYGWDEENKEAYNNLHLLEKFLLCNGFKKESFDLFDEFLGGTLETITAPLSLTIKYFPICDSALLL